MGFSIEYRIIRYQSASGRAFRQAAVPPGAPAIVARKTRATTSRGKIDEREDPFLLRGLLVCEQCGHTMTTSMSTALTKKTAPKAPRYYRCRTDGCDGGQIAATEVEDMVLDALRRPQWNWPDSAKQRLAQLASTWDV